MGKKECKRVGERWADRGRRKEEKDGGREEDDN